MKFTGKIRKDSIWGKKVKFPGSFLGSSSHLVDETENLRSGDTRAAAAAKCVVLASSRVQPDETSAPRTVLSSSSQARQATRAKMQENDFVASCEAVLVSEPIVLAIRLSE